MKMHVLLVGAGLMAREYAKVLESLNVEYTVIGRGIKSAEIFEAKYNKTVLIGGLEKNWDQLNCEVTHAIIATQISSLEENALFLLEKGVKSILLEKPGAVTQEGIKKINDAAKKQEAQVYIAYNRRFYASVLEAKKRIAAEGGLTSFLFEFTEWSHQLVKLNKTAFELENWFIGNSTHVVDAAFYFGGEPKQLSTFTQNKLDWHPKGSIFVGAGITENNVPFSYHANWNAPGSWKLELLTNSSRYIFRPFEQLHVQKIGSVAIEQVEIDDKLDLEFKPGLYKQVEQFLYGKLYSELLTSEGCQRNFEVYSKMIE